MDLCNLWGQYCNGAKHHLRVCGGMPPPKIFFVLRSQSECLKESYYIIGGHASPGL